MRLRTIINSLRFVALAQNLVRVVNFDLAPQFVSGKNVKPFVPQNAKVYAKKCKGRVYHRRFGRDNRE